MQSQEGFRWYNLVGLKRKGVSREDITSLRAAQTLAQSEGTFQARAKRLSEETNNEYVTN